MKKVALLLLIAFLLVTPLLLTSCEADEGDGIVDEIIISVLGEDNAFSKQMSSFKVFMQTEVYVNKLINAVKEIIAVTEGVSADDPLSMIGLAIAVVANWAAWLASIVVFVICTGLCLLADLCLMACYAVGFILLAIIYLFNSLLLWLAALVV